MGKFSSCPPHPLSLSNNAGCLSVQVYQWIPVFCDSHMGRLRQDGQRPRLWEDIFCMVTDMLEGKKTMPPKPGTGHVADDLGSLFSRCISDSTRLSVHTETLPQIPGVTVSGSPNLSLGFPSKQREHNSS